MRHFLLTAFVMAGCVLMTRVAAARPAGDGEAPPSEYVDAIELAVSEFHAGAYVEARAAFQRAHGIYPNARTLRGLGMVEFELKHYKQSVAYLEQALDSRVRPLQGELRKTTRALLERARGYLVTLRLSLDPQDARVLLDGAPLQLDDSGAATVQVGDHTLDVQAEGHVAVRRRISVAGGQDQRLRIQLMPLADPASSSAEAPPTSVPTDTARDGGAFYEQWWFWTLAGVVVAGAATTGVILTTRGDERAPGTQIDDSLNVMALELP